MGLKPDACVDQKSISRSCLLKTMWSQFVQEINFGTVDSGLLICVQISLCKKPFRLKIYGMHDSREKNITFY